MASVCGANGFKCAEKDCYCRFPRDHYAFVIGWHDHNFYKDADYGCLELENSKISLTPELSWLRGEFLPQAKATTYEGNLTIHNPLPGSVSTLVNLGKQFYESTSNILKSLRQFYHINALAQSWFMNFYTSLNFIYLFDKYSE